MDKHDKLRIGQLVRVGETIYRVTFLHTAAGIPGVWGQRLIASERKFSRGTSTISAAGVPIRDEVEVLPFESDPHALSHDNYKPDSIHRVARVRPL